MCSWLQGQSHQQRLPILEHLGGYTTEDAKRVARTLLPDILRYDPNLPAAYPTNGRALTDDVMDHFISIITNGKTTTDHVTAHKDLLALFPYVAPPHATATRAAAKT